MSNFGKVEGEIIICMTTDDGAENRIAKIAAQLVREGVRFQIIEREDSYVVQFNGGY